jgi:F-type H+-transporting ATPase subunit b
MRKHFLKQSAATVIFFFIFIALFSSFACASEGAGEGLRARLINFGWKFIDFAVMAGLLYWWIGKQAKSFFSGRREGIGKSLADAEKMREEAKKNFQEYSLKLDKATAEIDELKRTIKEQGIAESEKIISEAKEMAQKIKEDAHARMDEEFKKAMHQLRLEAAELSTQMAESLLREKIKMEDHELMVKDYIREIEKIH